MAQNDRMTHRQTDRHGDSMTDPAQRAESVKTFCTENTVSSYKKYKYQDQRNVLEPCLLL